MIQKSGGRKFLVTLFVMLTGIVLDKFFGGLSDNVMYLLMAATTGFGVVNVGKYAIERRGQPPAQDMDFTPVLEAVESLRPKRKASTTKVDLKPVTEAISQLRVLIEEKTAPGEAQDEYMNYLKAIQNQGVVFSDLLKQSTQLQVQTHQTLVSLIKGAGQG